MAGPSKLTRWQHRVREHDGLNATEKAVAYTLSTYMHKDTLKAWPSYETLAAGAGCSCASVRRAVKRLEDEGLIWRKPGRFTGRATHYTGRLSGNARGSQGVQKRYAGSTQEVVTVTTQHGQHVRTAGRSRPSGSAGASPSGARPGWQSEPWAQGSEGPEQRAERRAQVVAELERDPHGPYAALQDALVDVYDAFDTPAFDAAWERASEEWALAAAITTITTTTTTTTQED